MSTLFAVQSPLAASIPRAVFTFGTQAYTAVQTAGPSQAVIGTATITVGGQAAQLDGGYASLATNGLVFKVGTASQPITTSKSRSVVATGRRVQVTLASTTLLIEAPSGAVQAGTKIIGGSTRDWVVGQQTIRPVYNGVVVVSGSESETFTYSMANITRSATVQRTTSKALARSSFAASTNGSTSLSSLETTSLPASTTAGNTSSAASTSTFTETATVTSIPSDASSIRGIKITCMGMMFLLACLSAI